MRQKNHIVGCIDNSSSSQAVCLYSSWLAKRLAVPLTFLHVLEKQENTKQTDLSGSIGFDSKDLLMDELVKLEGERARLMMEQGKQLLEAAKDIAHNQGVKMIHLLQKRGTLPDILSEIQDSRMMVLGRKGEQSQQEGHVGSQLENVIRLQKIPVFVSVNDFAVPQKAMFAYDGSHEGKKVLARLSISPLLKNIDCHIVMNGSDKAALMEAQTILKQAGIETQAHLISGHQIPASLCQYAKAHDIDLIIMGAYGHSKLREFFIGSNTTKMITKTHVPLLMLR